MGFNSILENRHCVRHFKTKSLINFKQIAEILDAVRYSPMAGGIFTLRLIVVDDAKKKAKIADACLGQAFVAEAPYVVVVCSDMAQIEKSYGKSAKAFAKQQAGAAIENMFLKATEMKIGTCWVGAFDENPIKRELDLPESFKVEAVLPFGYEMGKQEKKEKIELKLIVRFNTWNYEGEYKPTWPEATATSNE